MNTQCEIYILSQSLSIDLTTCAVLSRKYAPLRDNPPPPNSFDENYCAGIIISEDSDCD